MSPAELANLNHESGFNCAQSVLAVFAEDYGMPLKLALKLASPFGGGMRMAATCGALTGALMALAWPVAILNSMKSLKTKAIN